MRSIEGSIGPYVNLVCFPPEVQYHDLLSLSHGSVSRMPLVLPQLRMLSFRYFGSVCHAEPWQRKPFTTI